MIISDGELEDTTEPIITLEVLTGSSTDTTIIQREYNDEQSENAKINSDFDATGIHFITTKENYDSDAKTDNETGDHNQDMRPRHDFMEYLTRNDGSVVCKLCGEILQSRTHWYTHKYKLHVQPPLNPAPLFKCVQCLVFFKSRKGFIGHLASRHSILIPDAIPVLTNTQATATEATAQETPQTRVKQETQTPEPEQSTTQEMMPTLNLTDTTPRQSGVEARRPFKMNKAPESPGRAAWDEERSREERLVTSIIDRVRRECEQAEANGSGGPARRGYTRRTTVMNT